VTATTRAITTASPPATARPRSAVRISPRPAARPRAPRAARARSYNGTNCTPNCNLHKVTAFSIDRDIAGPVYVNIAASTEVPGPGSATTTIHDTGFIKALKYSR
jgi:hypothetical protein